MVLIWLAKKWFFFKGVRFYESKGLPSNAEFVRIQFSGTKIHEGDINVTFEFFREVFRDKVYKKGGFTTKEYPVFLIKASFNGEIDEKLLRFNDTRLLCKSGFFPVLSDEVIAEVLQGLYIAYIKEQMTTTK